MIIGDYTGSAGRWVTGDCARSGIGFVQWGMRRFLALLLWCCVSIGLPAQNNPAFDLTGPRIDVHIKRGELTLPIGQVPSLPAHPLLRPTFPVIATLRGAGSKMG